MDNDQSALGRLEDGVRRERVFWEKEKKFEGEVIGDERYDVRSQCLDNDQNALEGWMMGKGYFGKKKRNLRKKLMVMVYDGYG